jgi:hypothetical protein
MKSDRQPASDTFFFCLKESLPLSTKGTLLSRTHVILFECVREYPQDFWGELFANRIAIQINYRYWIEYDFGQYMSSEDKQTTLYHIAKSWQNQFPDIHLFGSELIL